jgi:kumamolisin
VPARRRDCATTVFVFKPLIFNVQTIKEVAKMGSDSPITPALTGYRSSGSICATAAEQSGRGPGALLPPTRLRQLRILALAAVGALVLVAGLRSAQLPSESVIGGPYGWLLTSSTDLGPARSGHAQLTVALHHSTRPEALTQWAKSRGLSVRWRPGEDWAFVEGAPANVARAFRVAVHNYRNRGGQVFYASPQQPAVPVAVRGEATALGRILGYRPPHLAKPPNLPRDVPQPGLLPTQLPMTYNATPLRASGAGQTIVFYEWASADQSDLDAYSANFGLPKFTPTAIGNPPAGKDHANEITEATMDLEVAHAIAPEARLVVVNAATTIVKGDSGNTYENVAKLFATVDTQFPRAVWSLSIGWGCDRMDTATDLAPMRAKLAAATLHGTAAFDANGDTGGFECKQYRADPDGSVYSSPPGESDIGLDSVASLPAMTNVGGTTLSTDARGLWVAEQTWVESPLSQGTGGGVSAVFDRPSFQNTVSTPEDTRHRLTPDVAADADPSTGMYLLLNGQWQVGGGTSQAAPIWAGLAALMNQYLLAQGGKVLGDLNPLLYRIAAGAAKPAFHDVVLGGNAVNTARPGYDLVSGLGTPNVDNLVHDVLDIQQGRG